MRYASMLVVILHLVTSSREILLRSHPLPLPLSSFLFSLTSTSRLLACRSRLVVSRSARPVSYSLYAVSATISYRPAVLDEREENEVEVGEEWHGAGSKRTGNATGASRVPTHSALPPTDSTAFIRAH